MFLIHGTAVSYRCVSRQILLCFLFCVWGLAPLLFGLLFFSGETQIWLGDLRVVVVLVVLVVFPFQL
jgi:hypothetical protein